MVKGSSLPTGACLVHIGLTLSMARMTLDRPDWTESICQNGQGFESPDRRMLSTYRTYSEYGENDLGSARHRVSVKMVKGSSLPTGACLVHIGLTLSMARMTLDRPDWTATVDMVVVDAGKSDTSVVVLSECLSDMMVMSHT